MKSYGAAAKQAEREWGELLERKDRETARDFTAWAGDPVGFIRDVLKGEPWPKQEEIAAAVLDHSLVTVRSCHAAGKDWLVGRLALWWVYARDGLVILTGPTATQVEEILMRKEVRNAFLAGGLPGELRIRALRRSGEGDAAILAKTGTGVSALTGFHDHRVLYCITEAQDPDIEHAWDAAFGVATGADDRILTVLNPTEPDGVAYRAHQEGSGWHAIKIEAADIPNIREERVVVPGLLSCAGVERFRRQYTEESAVWVSRVLGEFPAESEEQAIPTDAIDAAFKRYPNPPAAGGTPFVLGVDPAGPGEDQFAVTVWHGWKAVEYRTWRHLEAPESAERILDFMRELRRGVLATHGGADVSTVYVDEIGIGHGLTGILKRECRGMEWPSTHVEGVNVSVKPAEPKRFVRWKDELIWRLREDLVVGRIGLAPNEKLREELMQLRVRQTPSGKIETEPKDRMRARLGRSPDVLDSLLLTVASRSPAGGGVARLIA